jgi:hypothetical protein
LIYTFTYYADNLCKNPVVDFVQGLPLWLVPSLAVKTLLSYGSFLLSLVNNILVT